MAEPPSSAREIERYAGLFARRTHGMTSSAMRDLMAVTAQPDVISLAGGLPDMSTFPAEDFAALTARIAVDATAQALQYGPTEGIEPVKACIAEVMAEEGMHVEHDDVLVTTGGQQVIDLFCRAFLDPGDVVVAEGPTYPGAVPVFASYQADVAQVPMDEDGMRMDDLEATLDRLAREGRTPKFVYTVPSFQNPGGTTLSLERRRRLVALAAERELMILEDNPYGLLRYEGEPLPTLFSLDGGRYVAYLGTFSKILSPGLRLGWAAAPHPVLDKLNLGKQAADLCSSPLSQHFVAAFFAHRDWRAHLQKLIGLYQRRRDVMLDALAEHFPREATWTRPQGGLFLWARLPDYIDTTDLLARALREQVAFVPGRAAYLDGRGGSEMRLNFSGVSDDEIREGVRRIGEVIREQVALYGTLTGADPALRSATVSRETPDTIADAREPSPPSPASGFASDVARGTGAEAPRGASPSTTEPDSRAMAGGPRGDAAATETPVTRSQGVSRETAGAAEHAHGEPAGVARGDRVDSKPDGARDSEDRSVPDGDPAHGHVVPFRRRAGGQ